MSLLARLFVLVAIAVLPATAMLALNQYEEYQARIADARDHALQQAKLVSSEQDRLVDGARQLVIALATMPLVVSRDVGRCTSFFQELIRKYDAYSTMIAIGPDGYTYCGSTPVSQNNVYLGDRSYFKNALATNGFVVGAYIEGRLVPNRVLPFAYPIVFDNGERGVMLLTLKLDWLARYLADRWWNADLTILIADQNGTILVRLPDHERWVGRALPDAGLRNMNAVTFGVVEMVGIDGVARMIGYSPLSQPPVGLYIGVGTTTAAALARVREAFWQALGWLAAGTLLALGVAWFGGVAFIRRPIAQLVRTAARWSDGDYAARARLTDRHSELGQLGATFDKMADQLDRRERELREATRAKTRLLAAAGHDFKQPLQTIAMSVDRLSGDRTTVERVHRMVDRIARSIDQLLIASRIELGTLQPAVREVPLGTILADAREICAPAALEKEVEFRIVDSSAWVRTDPDMLLTILINLIGNAVKYTKRGTVLVGCRRRGELLRIRIHDTGVGIAEDQLPRIFEEFQRLEPTQGGGYGLGLSIVRSTAALLGHKVSVTSTVGRGSCFEVELPLVQRANAPAPLSAAAAS